MGESDYFVNRRWFLENDKEALEQREEPKGLILSFYSTRHVVQLPRIRLVSWHIPAARRQSDAGLFFSPSRGLP